MLCLAEQGAAAWQGGVSRQGCWHRGKSKWQYTFFFDLNLAAGILLVPVRIGSPLHLLSFGIPKLHISAVPLQFMLQFFKYSQAQLKLTDVCV